jgi:hypothetical protein
VKLAREYGRGRGTCRSCRRAQQREHDRRAALAEAEEPHPGPGAQDGHKSQRRLASDRYWNERRRALIEQAHVTTEERDGRTWVVSVANDRGYRPGSKKQRPSNVQSVTG